MQSALFLSVLPMFLGLSSCDKPKPSAPENRTIQEYQSASEALDKNLKTNPAMPSSKAVEALKESVKTNEARQKAREEREDRASEVR